MNIRFVLFLLILTVISCKQHHFEDSKYKITYNGDVLKIEDNVNIYELHFAASDILRVQVFPEQDTSGRSEPTFAVVYERKSLVDVRLEEFEDSAIISSSKIIVKVYKNPLRIDYFNIHGSPLLTGQKIYFDSTGTKTISFKTKPGEGFYGMGQKSIPVNRRGYAFDVLNKHIGGYTKPYATQQVNIPYVYTNKGYGVLFDNPWPGHFDLAKTSEETWSYSAENGAMLFYLVSAKDVQGLQEKYYELTGYPPIPPKWALGLLQSKCGYENEDVVNEVVYEFEEQNLPLDAIILDAYWFGGYKEGYPHYMGNFTWLESNFPNPDSYLENMKEKGIKTILINEPYINEDSYNYDLLAENGWLVSKKGEDEPYLISPYWAGDASLFDITHPEARDWMWSQFQRLISQGVDGLWIDLTEPEHPIENGSFHLGSDRKIHNIYSNLFAELVYDGYRKDFPDKRVFNLTRAGYSGIQRFGAINWSGDASKTWIALKLQVPMLIGSAMSGLPHYSSDIGGFTNAHDRTDGLTIFTNFDGKGVLTTPELYTRWFQFGVFSPMLRPHSGEEQYCEPFAHGTLALDISAKYLKWRYRLLPYLYTYAWKTSTTSEQLIKPLFMKFDDENAHGKDYQYMFGKSLMVAPVLDEGVTELDVYFPEPAPGQRWIGFWNDSVYPSGSTVTVDAPLETIPVFALQPSIIPLAEVKKHVGASPDDTLTLRIYPGDQADFILYEDDGLSRKYVEGAFATTKMEMTQKNSDLEITIHPAEGSFEGMPVERTWILDLHLIKQAGKVKINGKETNDFELLDNNTLKIKTFSAADKQILISIKDVVLTTDQQMN